MKTIVMGQETLMSIFNEGNKVTRDIIAKSFPNLFLTELKKGVWYKHKGGTLFCWQPTQRVFGFEPNGEWCPASNGCWSWDKYKTEDVVLATPVEVKKAFIKEAKRRDYKKDGYRALDGDNCGFSTVIDSWTLIYNEDRVVLYSQREGKGGDTIFKDGMWAKQKDTKRIAQVKQEIEDLTLELEQLDKYYI